MNFVGLPPTAWRTGSGITPSRKWDGIGGLRPALRQPGCAHTPIMYGNSVAAHGLLGKKVTMIQAHGLLNPNMKNPRILFGTVAVAFSGLLAGMAAALAQGNGGDFEAEGTVTVAVKPAADGASAPRHRRSSSRR
jgi:hypothetical protein